jgi:hypothetical protein
MKNKITYAFILALAGLFLRFAVMPFLEAENWMVMAASILIIFTGGVVALKGSADIIEETTEILSEKTKLAGGLLQSIGTAFPDMVLGIIAAVISMRLKNTDYAAAVNFAVIAAATTFGSNIYNIAHATWCIYRQNLANRLGSPVKMFPGLAKFGELLPTSSHKVVPSRKELDTSIDIFNALTWLTALVAILMVTLGRSSSPSGFGEDLYQLIRPAGLVIFIAAVATLFYFRKTKREKEEIIIDIEQGEKFFSGKPMSFTWLALGLSGVAILFSAEAMVNAVNAFSIATGIPGVVTGAAAGIIGCLGEMIVIHNYSVNPKGRLADALVGVGMDNVVTTLGASIVALLGGIFLGGSSLIIIFVLILSFNTLLIWQVSKLENALVS